MEVLDGAWDPPSRLLYARACLDCGRLAQASRTLEGLSEAEKKEPSVMLLRAQLARQGGRPEAAAMILQGAVAAHPENARLWRELALFQWEIGQPLQAVASIQRSLELDGNQEDLARLSADWSPAAAKKAGNPALPDVPRFDPLGPALQAQGEAFPGQPTGARRAGGRLGLWADPFDHRPPRSDAIPGPPYSGPRYPVPGK